MFQILESLSRSSLLRNIATVSGGQIGEAWIPIAKVQILFPPGNSLAENNPQSIQRIIPARATFIDPKPAFLDLLENST